MLGGVGGCTEGCTESGGSYNTQIYTHRYLKPIYLRETTAALPHTGHFVWEAYGGVACKHGFLRKPRCVHLWRGGGGRWGGGRGEGEGEGERWKGCEKGGKKDTPIAEERV